MSLVANHFSKKEILKDRAHMFFQVRSFFKKRNVLEVDTPILSKSAPIDAHIDVMEIHFQNKTKGYLHTSPEYAMKRLLAYGMGDIYQLSHVFREEEVGAFHNPEFTMLEWYRLNFTLDQLIEETLVLIQLFIGKKTTQSLSYREAFLKFTGIDYLLASNQDLINCCHQKKISLPKDPHLWDKDTLLQFITAFIIEPNLQNLTVLHSYPASQAALAKTSFSGEEKIAERFEVYFKGIELANGFHELTDPQEQENRFYASNRERESLGKNKLPIDNNFLKALKQGLPDCSGVAVGFDRLLLLRNNKKEIRDVIPLSWNDL